MKSAQLRQRRNPRRNPQSKVIEAGIGLSKWNSHPKMIDVPVYGELLPRTIHVNKDNLLRPEQYSKICNPTGRVRRGPNYRYTETKFDF